MSDINRLLLFPESGALPENIQELVAATLSDMQFTGDAIDDSSVQFYVGTRFLDHMTFLGCSPAIALSPDEGDDYCFVKMGSLTEQYELIAGRNAVVPKCKQCDQKKENWRALITDDDFCSNCSNSDQASNLAWRRTAAMVRYCVEVMHIYPHEAIPSPEIMSRLESACGLPWRHAYIQADC